VTIAFASSLTGSFAADIALIAAAAIAAAALLAYRRPPVALSAARRVTLIALRAAALALVFALVLRPVAIVPPAAAGDVVVPVLIDVSRSMRIGDAGGLPSIEQARTVAQFDLVPALSKKYRAAVIAVGDEPVDVAVESVAARARRSDLTGAIARVRERFRQQRLAGIVLISDGADTGQPDAPATSSRRDESAPVFAIGV